METLLKQQGLQLPKVGEIIKGNIITKKGNTLYIDLGNFRTGIVYGQEFYLAKEFIKSLKEQDPVSIKVLDLENEDGYVELSLAQAGLSLGWQKLAQIKDEKTTVSVKIEEANRGGLIAALEGQKAFLPVSQLSNEHYPRIEEGQKDKILEELQKLVGVDLEVRIIDVDPSTNKLIISERASQNEVMQEVLSHYKVGDVVDGEISGVTDFGAFIKFFYRGLKTGQENMPLEGLVHISELDWQLIEDPRSVAKVGDQVQAKIISIEDGRLSLSIKALKKNPWTGVEEKYKKGDVVSGKLMKFNPFGAFIKLDENIHGLAHISEFGSEKKMKELIQPETSYEFKVLSVEPKEHRMSLKFLGEKGKEEKTSQ
ncbi:30S ribosomal protein S1 [Candidatus Parcubacteria bacterium]|nr:MAG: 30S ribosomal protein S1 [Candidatus Parcubacteria bacterium]